MKPEMIVALLAVLGYSELESQEGKVFLSSDDVNKLKAHYKKATGNDLELEGIAFDDKKNASFMENEILAINTLMTDNPIPSDDDGEEVPVEATGNKTVIMLAGESPKVATLEKTVAKLTRQMAKLADKPEDDMPNGFNHTAARNSKTHLFASNKSFDAFDNRPWNRRAAGLQPGATSYTPVDISKVNEDLGAYYRENKMDIISFLRAKNRLPAFWTTVSNIQDQVAYTKAFTGEVTQARKKKWLPKGNFEFQPEIAKVYPIQIDIEIAGHELQAMETSWMNNLAMVSKDGSQAFKMSFVAYLAGEILKKAAEEDQLGHIRGVYIATADNATVAGLAVHKQKGLLKLIKEAQVRRVYKPYDLGVPTESNIYDYVQKFVDTMPEYWRDLPGMVFYMSSYWLKAYLKRRETLFGQVNTYAGDVLTIDRQENIRLEPLPFFNDSKFMFCTTNDNISLLENVPGENTLLNMKEAKRDIAIYGDYKTGIHVWAFGYQWPVDVEMTDEKQIFFSNDIDILPDLFVDVPANATTLNAINHTSLRTGENTQATAITTISNVATGEYVYIKGNKGANASTIADAGHFDLAAAITLDENTLIKLYKRGTDDFVEIKRWNLALSNVIFLAANATTANAELGKHFVTVANSGATAFTNITNAVEGDVYILEGGSATNSTTIAASGAFSRISEAMTLALGHWIKVKFNGEKFVELERYTG